jgi:hypothetical protein
MKFYPYRDKDVFRWHFKIIFPDSSLERMCRNTGYEFGSELLEALFRPSASIFLNSVMMLLLFKISSFVGHPAYAVVSYSHSAGDGGDNYDDDNYDTDFL